MFRTMGSAIFATVVIASAPKAIANAATANAPSMTTTKVEGAGISLQYPSTWKVVALTKHNPKLLPS